MRQISQLKHDGPERLVLWEQSVALADCVFLYVYKCTREGPQALNALASWVPVITDIAAHGVRSVDAHDVCQGLCACIPRVRGLGPQFVLRCAQGGRADTVTALMVTALMAITTGARESMLHHVEASIGRAPGRLQGLLHTARDAPISRRLKAADLAKSYASMRDLVVSAPRFAKASLACEDELEAKDCALDVLGICLDATWDSVMETRARDPLMGRAMAEACALVGAMYAAAPANALAFMHSRVFAAMDAEFRQRMYAAAGHTEAGFFVMLADIVTSRDTADRVYQLLLGRTQGQGQGQGGALAITWDTLFDRFQGDEWTRDRHETALPVLQLTCKVARHSEAARTALAFTKWRYIKALLRSSCQPNVDAPARVCAMPRPAPFPPHPPRRHGMYPHTRVMGQLRGRHTTRRTWSLRCWRRFPRRRPSPRTCGIFWPRHSASAPVPRVWRVTG
jgi:hypothetical protein